jgi:hypothetical protein
VLDEIATGPHLNIHVENMWQNGYPPPISIKADNEYQISVHVGCLAAS